MSLNTLEPYLPKNSLLFLEKWCKGYQIYIKITKNRQSKLGDYRKLPNNRHIISINANLQKNLFFFVLTHEIAHLITFETYGRKILPHGKEWKKTFRNMLLDSISIYEESLQSIIFRFSNSPKANFMASPELVKYFEEKSISDSEIYVEDLQKGEEFIYRNLKFEMLEKRRKNYLCIQKSSGKQYIFKPLAKVEKIEK